MRLSTEKGEIKLLGSLAVEFFITCCRFLFCGMDNVQSVMGRGINCVELKYSRCGSIYNVVLSTCRNNYAKPCAKSIFRLVYYRLPLPAFHSEKLIIFRVRFHSDFFGGHKT